MTIGEKISNYFELSMDEKVTLINSIADMTDDEYTEYFEKFHQENLALLNVDAIPTEEVIMLEETVIARRIAALFQISVDAAYYIMEMKKTGTVSEEEEKILKDICEKSPVFQNYFFGSQEDFELADLIEYQNEKYAVLIPCSGSEYGEVIILKVEESEDGEVYSAIEDGDLLNAIFDIFKENHKEEFDFA